MANKQATGKKAKGAHEIIQRVRAAILGAFDAAEQNGKTMSQILYEEFEKNPLKFMEMTSKFIPKELEAEFTHFHNVINANPELTVEEWQSQNLESSGNLNPDHKPH